MGSRYLLGFQDIIHGGYGVMDAYMRSESKPEEELQLEDIAKARTVIRFENLEDLKRMAKCLNDMVERLDNVRG